MRQSGLMVVAFAVLLGSALSFAAHDTKLLPPGSASQAIRDLDNMLGNFRTGPHLSQADQDFNADLKRRIIHGTFDLRELCRLALAKHWDARTEDERNHFVDLLVRLLEERALFAKEQSAVKSKTGGKYRVTYEGERYLDAERTRALVRTKLIIPTENVHITLSYRLKRQDNQWKIFDLIVDDASLVENYRYQFNSIITQYSYNELVNRMTKKLDELQTKRKEHP